MAKQTASEIREKDSAQLARRAVQVQRGAARAAVLGVNDGLVSTLCIVLGVAAAGGDQSAVLLAGFAGLIAGAISMAAGEWISVKSQVDLFEGILSDLKSMVKNDRSLLEENLANSFVATGMSQDTSRLATAEVGSNESSFNELYASQVVGMNPDELGSPWRAAISSLALFAVGSLAPLSPWFFGGGVNAIISAIALTAAAGLIVGGYVANSSGKSISYGAMRQLLIIIGAAIVTYGIGAIFGTVTG